MPVEALCSAGASLLLPVRHQGGTWRELERGPPVWGPRAPSGVQGQSPRYGDWADTVHSLVDPLPESRKDLYVYKSFLLFDWCIERSTV